MRIQLLSRLHRNRCGIYGFRLVIPRSMRLIFIQNEYRFTLKTSDKLTAKRLALRLNDVAQTYFERIKKTVNFEEATNLAQEMLSALENDSPQAVNAYLSELEKVATGVDKTKMRRLLELKKQSNALEENKIALLKRLVQSLASSSESEVDSITCDFYADVTPIKNEEVKLSKQINELTLEVQSLLHEKIAKINLDEAKRNFESDKEKLAQFASDMVAKASLSSLNAQANTNPNEANLNKPKPLLSEVISDYCSHQLAESKWSAKTEDTVNEIFRMWLWIVGDMPIADYGHEQNRQYKAILQRLPPNINKSPKFKNRTIDEILALNEKPAANHTINKKLARVSSLFEWAISYGYTKLNPAKRMTIKSPKLARDERQVFSSDDLSKLFGSEVFIKKKYKHSYYYWLPLLALYTGARLNELCQLHLKDFDVVDGIDVIKINDDMPDKRLKTKAAVREIPIHSELIRFGILDYVNNLRKRDEIRLFPELAEGRDGYGHLASKWFARYRVKCGIVEEGKVFHSFRHTFIDLLKQSEVSKEKISELVGHEDESETFGRYGKRYNLNGLKAVVEKISIHLL
jgi:integrase